MNKDKLIFEINRELPLIKRVVGEIDIILKKLDGKTPDTVEITALAAFASQFYTGIENCLKRISKFNGIKISSSSDWHIQLFNQYCNPPVYPLPILFNDDKRYQFTLIRKFRHYFYHGYSFKLDWAWMKSGILDVSNLYYNFECEIKKYLNSL